MCLLLCSEYKPIAICTQAHGGLYIFFGGGEGKIKSEGVVGNILPFLCGVGAYLGVEPGGYSSLVLVGMCRHRI